MSHLKKFRKGWENEHIAKYLLSKFSFISSPTTIGDDLGVDFFYTIFDINDGKLKPTRNEFAVQIKSRKTPIKITKKIGYIYDLKIPYFVGVVNQKNRKLTLYSNDHFDCSISKEWPTIDIFFKFCDTADGTKYYHDKQKEKWFLSLDYCGELNFDSMDQEILEFSKTMS